MRPFVQLVLAAVVSFAAGLSARAQEDATVYMVTYIEVLPATKSQSIVALRQLFEASRNDADVVRFEVLQRTAPSNQFLLLEVWKNQEAFDAHNAAAHTKQFREKLQPLLLAPIDDRLSVASSVSPMRPGNTDGAVYVATHVDVGPPNRDKTVGLLKALADSARKEAGNLRFDVLQQKARTNHFTVVEVWKDQRSDDAHEIAAHTREFRAQLHPLSGALYDQRWYQALWALAAQK